MAKTADSVELVVQPDGQAGLLINGVEFPWVVLWDGVSLVTLPGGMTAVSVTFLANKGSAHLVPRKPATNAEKSLNWGLDSEVELSGDNPPPEWVASLSVKSDRWYLVRAGRGEDLWSWSTTRVLSGNEASRTWSECADAFPRLFAETYVVTSVYPADSKDD